MFSSQFNIILETEWLITILFLADTGLWILNSWWGSCSQLFHSSQTMEQLDFWLFLLRANSNRSLHSKFRLSGSTRPKLMLLCMCVCTPGGTRKYLKAQETEIELIAAKETKPNQRTWDKMVSGKRYAKKLFHILLFTVFRKRVFQIHFYKINSITAQTYLIVKSISVVKAI